MMNLWPVHSLTLLPLIFNRGVNRLSLGRVHGGCKPRSHLVYISGPGHDSNGFD